MADTRLMDQAFQRIMRATIERGLQLIATSGAYDRLRALRGKVKLSLDVKTLRADRR